MLELTVGELMNCDCTCCGPSVCVSDGNCSTVIFPYVAGSELADT